MMYAVIFLLFTVASSFAQAASTLPASQADEATRNRQWATEAAKAEKDPRFEFKKQCYPEKEICIKAYVTHDGAKIRIMREETDLNNRVLARGICDEEDDNLLCYNWDTGQTMLTGKHVNGAWILVHP